MDLSAPFVLLALDATDASGSVTFDLSVPADLPFDEVALQAIAREPGAVYATPAATVDVVDPALRVLVFTRTQGFRHGSISDGLTLLDTLALSNGWTLTTTEDPVVLATALPDTDVVVFLSTSGDVLGPLEEDALEAWVRGGGGWVGVHAASDTEYGWPFYGELVGAWFDNHPSIQVADLHVEDPTHPATEDLPSPWSRRDEWYNFQRNPRPDVDVLLTLDETTYSGGQMGADHPIAWSQTLDAGRAFYTALGHTSATYAEPAFQDHLEGAIVWAGQ
jgi:type 1 glutamine amidotransferase